MFNLSGSQFGMRATPRPSAPGQGGSILNQPGVSKMPYKPGSGMGTIQKMPYKVGSSLGKVVKL